MCAVLLIYIFISDELPLLPLVTYEKVSTRNNFGNTYELFIILELFNLFFSAAILLI